MNIYWGLTGVTLSISSSRDGRHTWIPWVSWYVEDLAADDVRRVSWGRSCAVNLLAVVASTTNGSIFLVVSDV